MTRPTNTALLASIRDALGLERPYVEWRSESAPVIFLGTGTSPQSGTSLQVLGGAVDASGRVGWIEQRTGEMVGDFLPVEIDVRIAWGGSLRRVVELETYNPYFGCRVTFARWERDVFLYGYHEKHQHIVARLPARGRCNHRLAPLGSSSCLVNDVIFFRLRAWPGLIFGRQLPSLRSTEPLFAPFDPTEGFYEVLQAEGDTALICRAERTVQTSEETPEPSSLRVTLPADGIASFPRKRDELIAYLREKLTATRPPELGADSLIESLASPFLQDSQPAPGWSYPQAPQRGPTHHWFAVEYYLHLLAHGSAPQASAWLEWLERVAAAPPVDESEHAAYRYMLWQTPRLVAACHARALPEHTGRFAGHPSPAVLREVLPGFAQALLALQRARSRA